MKNTKKIPIKNIINFHPELKDLDEEVKILERKALTSEFNDISEDKFEAYGVISTSSVDNDGDIIDPLGIKTDIYNGTVQWNHSLDTLPIATISDYKISETGVIGKFSFSKSYDFSIDCYNLIKEKILKGISIGFLPIKVLEAGTNAFNQYMNDRGWEINPSIKRIIAECLWIETSIVPVGCNNDALILYAKNFKSELSSKNFKLDKAIDLEQVPDKPEDMEHNPSEQVIDKIEEVKSDDNEVIGDITGDIEEQEIIRDPESDLSTIKEDSKEIVKEEIKVEESKKSCDKEPEKKSCFKIIRLGSKTIDNEILKKALKIISGKSMNI